MTLLPTAGATSWACPLCTLRVTIHFPVFARPLCSCRGALLTFVGFGPIDCGDFIIRVVPSWE